MGQDHEPDGMGDNSLRATLRAPAFWAILILCCAVEFTLQAADFGLIGTRIWRSLAYQNGAFWAGLLHNWRPNYPEQPWLMFATYGFLHTGFWHLTGNMMTLFFLSGLVLARAGQRGFLVIYAASAFGGAAVFGLFSGNPQPVVGASGALFGLAGALLCWDWIDRRQAVRRLWPVWRAGLGLLLLNFLLWLFMKGQLAWDVHIGGLLAGGMAALGLHALSREKEKKNNS